MMTRLFFCFQIVGGVVCIVSGSVGAVLLLVWLADVALTQVLRATKSFGIVLRYAWLEGNKRQQLKDDLAEDERRRKFPPLDPVPEIDDEPRWFYAHHPDDEHWEDACSKTREEAIEEALHHALPGDTIYVVLGKRPTTDDFAQCISERWVLDQIIDHASDEGLLGDSDESIRWTSALGFEVELQDVIARYLTRPRWWCCDGSLAEAVTKPPDPSAGADPDSDTSSSATPDEQSRSPSDPKASRR